MEINRRFYCDERTEVETAEGRIRGAFLNDHYYFRGIPYATAKRFEMPEPMPHWDGFREAVTYGPTAPTVQKPSVLGRGTLTQQPLFGYRFWPEDEFCQYLNVWTKEITPGRKRPVMVWVHGGGIGTGSAIEQISFEGANLCRDGDLVVVSFNHRLNILGYLDMSDFGEKYANSANCGIADIVAVLEWIHRNIDRFGGDPENVTLFGHSGGGGKIRNIMQIPAADGLYHKVIFQSGLMNMGGRPDPDAGRRVADRMVERLGYSKETFDEFCKVPFDVLRQAYLDTMAEFAGQGGFFGGLGTKQNDYYIGEPHIVGFNEYAKKVPVIAGSVQCESALYAPFHRYDSPESEKEALLDSILGDKKEETVTEFRKAYPDGDLLDLFALDYIVRKGTYDFLDLKDQFNAPQYNYLITYRMPYMGGMPSYHGICLPLVFGNTEYVDAFNEPDLVALGQKMHQAWINFATTGDPNGGDVPRWERYAKEEGGTMVFDRQCGMKYNFDRELIRVYEENTNFRNAFMHL
ncbi:MAG: carboxylesterase/lipase family protein [Oscillospiraceae bacterium]|nr:carboxylesterase/lipase family protein [Oscillospiraceae bacterium]